MEDTARILFATQFVIVFVATIVIASNPLPVNALTASYDSADSDNWHIRFDGASAGDNLVASGVEAGDLDNDGYDDLVLGAPSTDYNSRSNAGSFYIFFKTFLDDYDDSFGNTIDLSDEDNFNMQEYARLQEVIFLQI